MQKERRLRVGADARLFGVGQRVLAEIDVKGGTDDGFSGYERLVIGAGRRNDELFKLFAVGNQKDAEPSAAIDLLNRNLLAQLSHPH